MIFLQGFYACAAASQGVDSVRRRPGAGHGGHDGHLAMNRGRPNEFFRIAVERGEGLAHRVRWQKTFASLDYIRMPTTTTAFVLCIWDFCNLFFQFLLNSIGTAKIRHRDLVLIVVELNYVSYYIAQGLLHKPSGNFDDSLGSFLLSEPVAPVV